MARDVTTWAIVGGGLFLLTPTGQQLIDTVVGRVKEIAGAATADPTISTPESRGIPIPDHLDSYVPGQENYRPTPEQIAQWQATPETQRDLSLPMRILLGSTAFGPDADTYQAFRGRLPTSSLNAQIWVRSMATDKWQYVTSPADYGRFGIAADESNVTDVQWPTRAFRQNINPLPNPALGFWVRSDTPSGVDNQYPQVPWAATQALRDGYARGYIAPISVTGYAILKQQGAI